MRKILQELTAIAEIGPALRRAARRALADGSQQRMRQAGRAIIGELQRRGDLSRVLVGGRSGHANLFTLRGGDRVLDLDVFFAPLSEPAGERRSPAGEEDGGSAADPLGSYDVEAHELLLSAMESAQSLQIEQQANGSSAAVLDSILGMLLPFLGGAEIYLELVASPDPPDPAGRVFLAAKAGRPFWALTRVAGEAIWIPSWSELPGKLKDLTIPADEQARSGRYRFGCGVAVPLFAPVEVDDRAADGSAEAGLLYLVHRGMADREQMLRLGFRISRFVTHCWRQKLTMSHLVHTDNLTGVRNRAFFDNQFNLEIERARRNGSPLVLLLGDIDHFKLINDRHGHQVGDRVLQTVAREMLHGLRRIDMVCRVGGEEFALVLPETGLEAAMEVINRIQVRIGNLRLSDPASPEPIRVTISFGGVPFPEGGVDADQLYRRADQMLYLSKERGRNRCHFWNPDGEPLLTLPGYRSS